MGFRKFLSSIGIGSLTVDTVVESTELSEDRTLTGRIYIEGNDTEQEIEFIELVVVKRKERYSEFSDFDVIDTPVTKQSLEVAGGSVSKNTHILDFQITPDDRWETEEEEKLILKTVVHILNGIDVSDEDEITYETED